MRLVTGAKQSSALSLYSGFACRTREPFGRYTASPLAVFMEKPLTSNVERLLLKDLAGRFGSQAANRRLTVVDQKPQHFHQRR